VAKATKGRKDENRKEKKKETENIIEYTGNNSLTDQASKRVSSNLGCIL